MRTNKNYGSTLACTILPQPAVVLKRRKGSFLMMYKSSSPGLGLTKLKTLQVRFYDKSQASLVYTIRDEKSIKNKSGYYRHRLCNPLWRWATQRMLEKWIDGDNKEEIEERYVSTCLPEDYERINLGFGWRPDDV
jgi:hypothetical protein